LKSCSTCVHVSMQDVYKVSRGMKRGRAVIISNEFFTVNNLGKRSGNSTDVVNLKNLLESLHFTVETVGDKTDEVLGSNTIM